MSIYAVDVITLRQWLADDAVQLIDVREPDEHAEAHIEQAILLPLSTFDLASIPPAEGKKRVIHCRSGKRSMRVCELLLAADPASELYNLEGGILAWLEIE
jgi:rhodanese-related sulfurtransferase